MDAAVQDLRRWTTTTCWPVGWPTGSRRHGREPAGGRGSCEFHRRREAEARARGAVTRQAALTPRAETVT